MKRLLIIFFCILILGIGAGIYVFQTRTSPEKSAIETATTTTEPVVDAPGKKNPPVVTTCQTDRSATSRLLISNRTTSFQYIAHTLGMTAEGRYGTNTKEAFKHSYENGFRLFEADFLETKDGHVIVAHDNHEGYWQLPTKFEDTLYKDLKDAKFMGIYTTMDVYALMELMKEYPDTYIVIDNKFSDGTDYDATLKKIISAGVEVLGTAQTFDRFIPQIYFPEDISRNPTICQFTDIMFTQYRNNLAWDTVYQFLQSTPGVTTLVTPYPDRYQPYMKDALAMIDKPVYVHPVRTSTLQQELVENNLGVFTSVSTTIE